MPQKHKSFGIASVVFSLIILSSSSIHAQEETSSSASESSTPQEITITKKTQETTQTATQILQNLERLAKNPDQSEKIKDQYDGVTNKTRGFIAQITSVKDDSFKIITPNGEELFIAPDKSTTITKKGEITTGENYTLADWFAIDDWLVLIGVQNGDLFQPRRIIVSSEPLTPEKHFVIRGLVKTSTSTKVDIQIIGTDTVETFKLEKSTNLVNQDNETITYQDLTLDTPVLLIGTQKGDSKNLQTLRLL